MLQNIVPSIMQVRSDEKPMSGMFAALTNFLTNNRDDGQNRLETVRENSEQGIQNANNHVNDTINPGNQQVSGAATWGS